MEPPSKPMKIEAADAAFHDSKAWGSKHPKLQILTIADLLVDKRIDYPPRPTSPSNAPPAPNPSATKT